MTIQNIGRIWNETSRLFEQESWIDGLLEGERKTWYENGNLQIEEFYRHGCLEGEADSGMKVADYVLKNFIKMEN